MNELIYKGVKVDLPEIVNLIESKIKEYETISVDENNYLFVENQRKDLTAILDSYKRVLRESEEDYLQPYKSLVEPLKNALDTLSQQEQRIKIDILTQKKVAFKEEVRKEFYQLCELACQDGVIPNFEEIYEESWYSKPKKTWRELLIKKLQKATKEDKATTVYIVAETVESKVELIKRYLIENQIVFRIETLGDE